MIFKVHLLNQPLVDGVPVIREVEVPNSELRCLASRDLHKILLYGQNDRQFVPDRESIGLGDVIEYKNSLYAVCRTGFDEISQDEFLEMLSLKTTERYQLLPTTGSIGV